MIPIKLIKPATNSTTFKIGEITCTFVTFNSDTAPQFLDLESDGTQSKSDTVENIESGGSSNLVYGCNNWIKDQELRVEEEPTKSQEVSAIVDMVPESAKKPEELFAWSSSLMTIFDKPEGVGTGAVDSGLGLNQVSTVRCTSTRGLFSVCQ